MVLSKMIQRGKIVLAVAVLGVALVSNHGGLAQTIDAVKAAKVKSGYVINFAKFTTWSDEAFSNEDSPLVICIWDHNPLERSLEEIIKDREIGGRKVVISRIEGHAADTTASKKYAPSHDGEMDNNGPMNNNNMDQYPEIQTLPVQEFQAPVYQQHPPRPRSGNRPM